MQRLSSVCWVNRPRVAAEARASGGAAARSSFARPPSSGWVTSRPTWSSHGFAAAIVAGSSSKPGRETIASARSGGSASLSARSDGVACSSVGASSASVASRFTDSAANAPAVTLKFVIRLERSVSREASFPNTAAWARISAERSCGFSPSSASLTIAESRPAGPADPQRVVQRLGRRLALRRSGPGRRRRRRSARR